MAFKLNDKVKWTSSSNGVTKTKTGVIVDIIPPKGRIPVRHRDFGLEGYGLPRNHESYVVHVAGKTDRAMGKRYWPLVNKIKPA